MALVSPLRAYHFPWDAWRYRATALHTQWLLLCLAIVLKTKIAWQGLFANQVTLWYKIQGYYLPGVVDLNEIAAMIAGHPWGE